MSTYYKKLLRNIYLSITLFFIIVLCIVYSIFRSYALEENAAKMQDLIMHNKALHTYVEETLKPVIYNLQNKGFIDSQYFDPKILSFTYISRHIMQQYNEQRKEHNLEPLIYKIASTNPRNLVNSASENEKNLLKKFNNGELKKFTTQITKENHNYIYYAMPISKNKESCMRCHSTPDVAPAELIKKYGSTRGFNEKIGEIRAFISTSLPLDIEINKMQELYNIFIITLGFIFIICLLIIYFFIRKLDKKDQKLQNQVMLDGLTKIFNRYKFNIDIDNLKNLKKDENVYMIMFDIDHFKKINDKYGHPVGDTILKELSSSIKETIRPTDRFYRVGGEEFAILSIANNTNTQKQFANRILNLVRNKKFSHINNLTISIGYTKLIKDEEIKYFYERCDQALYFAKNNGRNCIKEI